MRSFYFFVFFFFINISFSWAVNRACIDHLRSGVVSESQTNLGNSWPSVTDKVRIGYPYNELSHLMASMDANKKIEHLLKKTWFDYALIRPWKDLDVLNGLVAADKSKSLLIEYTNGTEVIITSGLFVGIYGSEIRIQTEQGESIDIEISKANRIYQKLDQNISVSERETIQSLLKKVGYSSEADFVSVKTNFLNELNRQGLKTEEISVKDAATSLKLSDLFVIPYWDYTSGWTFRVFYLAGKNDFNQDLAIMRVVEDDGHVTEIKVPNEARYNIFRITSEN